jgi:hypothetical protein
VTPADTKVLLTVCCCLLFRLSPAVDCVLQSPQRVRCSWNNVAPADTKLLQFTVKGTQAGTFTNTARVSSTDQGVAPKEADVPVFIQPETVPPVDRVSGICLQAQLLLLHRGAFSTIHSQFSHCKLIAY